MLIFRKDWYNMVQHKRSSSQPDRSLKKHKIWVRTPKFLKDSSASVSGLTEQMGSMKYLLHRVSPHLRTHVRWEPRYVLQ